MHWFHIFHCGLCAAANPLQPGYPRFAECSAYVFIDTMLFIKENVILLKCLRQYKCYSARQLLLEMWANAQRDGRPAEYRWRPLFNAAVWLTPTTRVPCSKRRETRWNYLGCTKLTKRSQPLVGRSSPYCGDMSRRCCCLTSFFSDCRYVP